MAFGLPLLNTLHWLGAVVMLTMAVYSWKYRRRQGVLPQFALFLQAGLWALIVALSFQVSNLELAILLNRLKMLTVPFITVAIFGIALSLDTSRNFSKWLWRALFIIPSISVTFLLSPWHHELLITGYHFTRIGGMEVLAFENGPWFAIHITQARILMIASFILILRARQQLSPIHRGKTVLIGLSLILPFLVDSLGIMAFPSLRYLQLVPAFFILTSLTMAYAVLRHKILNVAPAARSQILDSSPEPFMVFDSDLKLVDFNFQAQKDLDVDRSKLGQKVDLVLAAYPEISALVHERKSQKSEWHRGDQIFEVSIFPIQNPGLDFMGVGIVMRDITTRKQAERELRELNEMKTNLLAIVGHDLQGNLASLALTTNNLLNSDKVADPDINAALEDIQYSTRACIKFVDELISWSKAQTGRFQIRPVDLDLKFLLTETLQFLQAPILEKNLNVNLEHIHNGSVHADRNMLATVLRNLLHNAIKFSPIDGEIQIKMKSQGERIVISIEDEGPGVKPQDQSRLFDLTRRDRSGLGLLLCAEFIQRLAGEISYQDRKPTGARFLIELPMPKQTCSREPMPDLSTAYAPAQV